MNKLSWFAHFEIGVIVSLLSNYSPRLMQSWEIKLDFKVFFKLSGKLPTYFVGKLNIRDILYLQDVGRGVSNTDFNT